MMGSTLAIWTIVTALLCGTRVDTGPDGRWLAIGFDGRNWVVFHGQKSFANVTRVSSTGECIDSSPLVVGPLRTTEQFAIACDATGCDLHWDGTSVGRLFEE
jgi:hypothetical protein